MFKQTVKDLFSTLYKNVIIILIVATLSVALSVGYVTTHAEAKYVAKAEVLLHSYAMSDLASGAMIKPTVSVMDSALEIFNSQSMFKTLDEMSVLSKHYSADELDRMIEVTRKSKKSLVLCIEVSAKTKSEANDIIRAMPNAMQTYFHTYTGDFYLNTLYVDTDAKLVRPNTIPVVAVSLVAGAFLGSVAVIIFDRFNRKLRSPAEYRARYSATLLGTVPDFSTKKKEGK